VLCDLRVDAVKLGMLGNAEVIHAVADTLQGAPQIPVILDPVMLSKSGAPLLAPEAVEALRQRMLPRACVLTPNLPEAAALLGVSESAALGDHDPMTAGPASDAAMESLCRRLHALGPQSIVLKGGHIDLQGHSSDDLFWDGRLPMRLHAPRIATRNTHGTGCTYAAAIAAGLARGESVRSAVIAARQYVQQAIIAGASLHIGDGHGPLHHFAGLWPQSTTRGS
jgi:hydroxymethylpyrimidine/phosphomethylpyrimidine kinase